MYIQRDTLILIATALVQAALWFAVLRIDPFGMSSSADRASEEIFLRLYPTIYGASARDQISVVLVDQDNLVAKDNAGKPLWPRESNTWPIKFDEHIDLIRTILKAQPKALFVDFLYDSDLDDKRGERQFRELLGELPNNGPPIVFATMAPDPSPLIEPLKSLTRDPQQAKRLRARVMQTSVEHFSEQNHYEVLGPTGLPQGSGALWELAAPAQQRIVRTQREMLLVWGNTIKASANPADVSWCAPIFDEPESRLRGFVETVRIGLTGKIAGDRPGDEPKGWNQLQPCLYHDAILAGDLYQPGGASSLRGKYVFLGVKGNTSNDTVVSPVHGQVPGIFYHAMAFDNLLTYQGRYLHASQWVEVLQFLLIFIVLLGGSLFFRTNFLTPLSRWSAFRSLAARAMAWIVFSLISTVLLTVFLTQLYLTPYNWGGVAAISGIALFTDAGRELRVLLFGRH